MLEERLERVKELQTQLAAVQTEMAQSDDARHQTLRDALEKELRKEELEIGREQTKLSREYELQTKVSKYSALSLRSTELEEKLQQAFDVMKRMPRQIEIMMSEKNILLQEMAQLKQHIGSNGVN